MACVKYERLLVLFIYIWNLCQRFSPKGKHLPLHLHWYINVTCTLTN